MRVHHTDQVVDPARVVPPPGGTAVQPPTRSPARGSDRYDELRSRIRDEVGPRVELAEPDFDSVWNAIDALADIVDDMLVELQR